MPSTPKQVPKPIDDINPIILKLISEFGLPLRPRSSEWSPFQNTGDKQDEVFNCIKLLFHKDRARLHQILEQFRCNAQLEDEMHRGKPQYNRSNFIEELLSSLLNLLQGATKEVKASMRKSTQSMTSSSPSNTVIAKGPVKHSATTSASTSFTAENFKVPTLRGQLSATKSASTSFSTNATNSFTGGRFPDPPAGSESTINATKDSFRPTYTFTPNTSFNSTITSTRSLDGTDDIPNSKDSPKKRGRGETTDLTDRFQAAILDSRNGRGSGSNYYRENPDSPAKRRSATLDFQATKTAGRDMSPPIDLPGNDTEDERTARPPSPSPKQPAEQHRVRDLPKAGLFFDIPEESTRHLPFPVQFECARLLLGYSCQEKKLPEFSQPFADYDSLWTQFHENLDLQSGKQLPKVTADAWKAATEKNFDGVTLKGSLSISSEKKGHLFKLQLEPLSTDDFSCRFQRRFGGDRFLYLDIPALSESELPSYLKGQIKNIERRYQQWLMNEIPFLGRFWRVLMLEPKKPKKRKDKAEQLTPRMSIILFATHGLDLDTKERPKMSIEDLFRWFLPVEKELDQSFCKAYARVELGFSKTQPTVVFKPSEIKHIGDIKSNDDGESTLYRDSSLDWARYDKECERSVNEMVMNDGCALMSVGAQRAIWRKLGMAGIPPSSFQARLGGAKGMWTVSPSSGTTDDEDIWIQVTDSQRKFKPHDEDTDKSFDPHRHTFEVIGCSHGLTHTELNIAFLPILTDRGVPRSVLERVIQQSLDYDRQELLAAFESSKDLRKWIHDNNRVFEDRVRESDMVFEGSMPRSNTEWAVFLLESGFKAATSKPLASIVLRLFKQWAKRVGSRLDVKLGRSTNAFAIADPIGVLRPGEVHFAFSGIFTDERSGFCEPFLDDMEILLTRQPAFKNSDIQKVRAVYKPELAAIKDVLVFPSCGQFPLAKAMQGGDYDGDRFWVCWDPSIVKPFKNAPPLTVLPSAEKLGIHIDNMKLGEFFSNPNRGMDDFLSRSLKFRCNDSMLGLVSNFHKRFAYRKNSLCTPAVTHIAALREHLVDASKSGYKFDRQDWQKFLRAARISPNEGKYKTAYESAAEGMRISDLRINFNHIIDYLRFRIVEPHIVSLREEIAKKEENTSTEDSDITQLWEAKHQEIMTGVDHTLKEELIRLERTLKRIKEEWHRFIPINCKKGKEPRAVFDEILETHYPQYHELMPQNTDHPIVREWVYKTTEFGPTTWDLLKASALYSLFQNKIDFVFKLAGSKVGYMKSFNTGTPHVMTHELWSQMAPRRQKKIKMESMEFESDDDDFFSVAEYPEDRDNWEGM